MPSKYVKSTKPRKKPSGRKAPPTGTDADINLSTLSHLFADETAAREWLEAKRWPDGKPVCPHCGEIGNAYKLTSKPDSKHKVTPGTYKCAACRKKFSVRVGTIFEDSHVPISKWLMAFHLMASSKKGVSARQLARELDITPKSAWFVAHRVRECMRAEPVKGMLAGVVEADEVWVGGRPRHTQTKRPAEYKPGRKWTNKSPVLVLVERDGDAVCRPLMEVTKKEIAKAAKVAITPESILMTDEAKHYVNMGREFAAHHTTTHSAKEYARKLDDGMVAHSNTAESFSALLQRGHYGIFHRLSKHHLHRYCTEFEFRWNHRKISDGHRMVKAIEGAEGKRLVYREPAKNNVDT
jgi:transposase-like protein